MCSIVSYKSYHTQHLTYVKLPDFGRLAIRVLVGDSGGGGAQGPGAEHAVNLGGGCHDGDGVWMLWMHAGPETNWLPVLMT